MTENVNTYVFKLEMKCVTCVKKISKVLDAIEDNAVVEYKLLFEEQLIEVTTTLPAEVIITALRTTGKEVTLVSST